MKRFITHVFNEGVPQEGLKKLTYLTVTDEVADKDEFFLGLDNNPLENRDILSWVKQGKLFIVHEGPFELKPGKSLFIDSGGNLFMANRLDPDSGKEKLNIHIKEFVQLSGRMKAKKFIPKNELPIVLKYHEYA